MKSRTTKQFRAEFESLPPKIQRQAREAYRLFQQDPHHPGLHFKQIEGLEGIYSVRVGLHYRAVGARGDDAIVWFWIGSHSDYDKLLSHR